MDVCKVNHEASLMLEQPLIKVMMTLRKGLDHNEASPVDMRSHQVPYEQLRRNFKASQKAIERDYQAFQKESADVAKNKRSSEQALKTLDGMINRVEGLKRKVSLPVLHRQRLLVAGWLITLLWLLCLRPPCIA